MSIVKDEHKVALRKWHEELQDEPPRVSWRVFYL